MSTRKEALALVIKELEFTSQQIIDEFKTRFRIQKCIFLLQEWKNYNWRYSFNLYISGPYSPDLTEDFYDVSNNMEIYNDSDGELKDDFKSDLNEIKSLISDDDKLEAIATLLYIERRFWGDPSNKEEDTKRRFKSTKPFIPDSVRDEAWDLLVQKGAIANE